MTTEAITWAELPEDIQQAFGSYERINERMRVFTGATNRLWARKKELTEQYPNQYAASCGDELVIAKSFPELLSNYLKKRCGVDGGTR